MLYVFYGTDTIQTRAHAFEFISQHAAKGIGSRTLAGDSYQEGSVRGMVGGVSLFAVEELIVLDTLSDSEGALEELLEMVEHIGSSTQTFVVIEGSLTAAQKKVLEIEAETMIEAKVLGNQRFNAFSMADALAKRDKKSLWLIYTEAKVEGLSAEEIIGTLFWQLKALRLAKVSSSAEEVGMKDFPFNKAKTAARSFKDAELQRLSDTLITLYHEGHLGSDIDLALEKWVLTI